MAQRRKTCLIACIPLLLALLRPAFAATEGDDEINRIRSALVRIKSYAQRPNYNSPWKEFDYSARRGSGFIIKGQRILTNAHLVSDSKYLEIEKENSSKPYRAVVSFIGHDCDLALLEVADRSFFDDTTHLEFSSEMPGLQSTVLVYGFPTGGQRVSVTRGIVSRIDYAPYSHSASDAHLIIQIDAAINNGNSGGPVMQDGKVIGVAFQFGKALENVGHAVPLTVIEHFLADIADGSYDGYPELGLFYSDLSNEAYRRYVGLDEEQTGVVVRDVIKDSSAGGSIVPRDILVSIDGHPVRNDGSILVDGESYNLAEVVERKQVGEPVEFEVKRGGKEMSCRFPLKVLDERMARSNTYDRKPEYFIFGGLIFQPLSREYLRTWSSDWWNRADKRLLYYYNYYYADKLYLEKPVPIVLSRVLPAPVNRYYTGLSNMVVKKINGKEITNLADAVDSLEGNEGEHHAIEFEGSYAPCILDTGRVAAENPGILEEYGISSDRYLGAAPTGGAR